MPPCAVFPLCRGLVLFRESRDGLLAGRYIILTITVSLLVDFFPPKHGRTLYLLATHAIDVTK